MLKKGSSLCPLGQAVMGGAFNKDEDDGGNVEGWDENRNIINIRVN